MGKLFREEIDISQETSTAIVFMVISFLGLVGTVVLMPWVTLSMTIALLVVCLVSYLAFRKALKNLRLISKEKKDVNSLRRKNIFSLLGSLFVGIISGSSALNMAYLLLFA